MLNLLFTKDGLQYQEFQNGNLLEEHFFFTDEQTPEQYIATQLNGILSQNTFSKIQVISALNHFTLMPEGFSQHDLGYELIAYNAPIDKDNEELMLSINKKYEVQFYYSLPKEYYQKIKNTGKATHFNFSGEQFLRTISPKKRKEIHINLYHHQCEFFALDDKKVILYNNLDVNSEVDFLYFVMFTLSKIEFGIHETHFYVYGETKENETFITELQKFVKKITVVFSNQKNKNFILNSTTR